MEDYCRGSLEHLTDNRSKPDEAVCEHGPEFTSQAPLFWARSRQLKLGFVQSGELAQNAFVVSLHGTFRNACLNQHWFHVVAYARYHIDRRRHEYNRFRPHSSLDYMQLEVFVSRAV